MANARTLSAKQQAIAPITAAAAAGDMPRLNAALVQGLDAGLTISEVKEILVQLYAYAGFPRSLNALGEAMKVLQARRQRGVQDAPGREPAAPVPTGRDLPQLQAHVWISMNVGLTADQLRHLADVLALRGWPEAAKRARCVGPTSGRCSEAPTRSLRTS